MQLVAADAARRADAQGCANVGCSIGIDYVCCASLPPETDGSYAASAQVGAIDRITISKTDEACTTIELRQAPVMEVSGPLEVPEGWMLQRAGQQACSSSANPPQQVGAIGVIALGVSGDECVLDAHLTLFFPKGEGALEATPTVTAERFDVEGLVVEGLKPPSCQ